MVKIKDILLRLLVWCLVVLAVMVLGYFLLPSRYAPLAFLAPIYRSTFLLWSWANFDGEHYLLIAQYGYQMIAGQSEYAFFPLFPLVIRFVGMLLLGDYYLASHLIVICSLIGFAYFLTRWTSKMGGKLYSILLQELIFPGAIFLASIYTEPLYLFLTIIVFIFAENKQWGRAALFTAFATATRINGVFLVLFLLIKMFRQKLTPLSIISNSLLSISGLLSYMTYLYLTTGNALSFYVAQSGWGKSTLTMPWDTVIRYTQALTTGFIPDLTHLVVAVEVVVTLYLITLFVLSYIRHTLDLAYLIYCLGNLALPLATGSLGSMPRFGLLLFPLFLVLGSFSKPKRVILYVVSGTLAVIGVILFTRGYWWA
ncbi:MAG: mannosyltransferase family protein [bacterium]